MTHTPKQTDVQGRGVVLRLEPGTVAHDWDTGAKDLSLPGPRTCVASVFAELGGRAGGQLGSEALHDSSRGELDSHLLSRGRVCDERSRDGSDAICVCGPHRPWSVVRGWWWVLENEGEESTSWGTRRKSARGPEDLFGLKRVLFVRQ